MVYEGNSVKDVKIAYVGGGSRGWAWGLMSDLIGCEDMSGCVRLYDIDRSAAERNIVIGNKFNTAEGAKSHWEYTLAETLDEALTGADFVVISIMPGTLDEMESDVHAPEEYGVYQSVGDTVGLGGIIRTLRTLPMIEDIGRAVAKTCPKAWVINYTNPMTLCIKALYRVFPEIKAFGCCHEVFGTQALLATVLEENYGIKGTPLKDIKVNVIGINHFTWITKAWYRDIDLMKEYAKFVDKYYENGYLKNVDTNWLNRHWFTGSRVKMDLFKRYGYIAAAGDRHLAEFCPGNWYLKDEETIKEWQFALTPVSLRRELLAQRYRQSDAYLDGTEDVAVRGTGEDGVQQMRALLGLREMVTNVNIPNYGQIPNLPIGAIVETNAVFRSNEVSPICAGEIPMEIYSLITRIVGEQEALDKAVAERDLDKVFSVFITDPQMRMSISEAKTLFDKMIENTKAYLSEYFYEDRENG